MSMALVDARSGDPSPGGSGARRLEHNDLDAARAVIASSFGIPIELGAVALPAEAFDDPKVAVWGAFDTTGALVSTLILARVQDAVVPWSMATIEAARGAGHGSRLLGAALGGAAEEGAELALLQSSPTAIGFYRGCGFTELETWQIWSRPRWVLGRA
jgi:GNAT superfamily N-acetyltransferase